MSAHTEVKIGDLAEIIAAPGYPTDAVVEVVEVEGRTLRAHIVTTRHTLAPEVYTLRRNGKWARKGDGQWSNYLRFREVGA